MTLLLSTLLLTLLLALFALAMATPRLEGEMSAAVVVQRVRFRANSIECKRQRARKFALF